MEQGFRVTAALDAQRESFVATLSAAYAHDDLTLEVIEERLELVYRARDGAELRGR